jgi:hypothetical protein
MKYVALFLFICSKANAFTFNNDDFLFCTTGFATYIKSTSSLITPNDDIYAVINSSISNNYGYISSQVSTNPQTPLRRLTLNIPLISDDNYQIELAAGRLSNAVGFIDSNSMNPQINGLLILPLSTYDPRRYRNMPDITDGGQINITTRYNNNTFKLKTYVGKQVFDDPIIPVYGSNFSLSGSSDIMLGFNAKWIHENTTVQYTFTYNDGTIEKTTPPYAISYINTDVTQYIHFLGIQHFIGKFKLQSEATYRDLNTTTDETGVYITGSYNFKDKWNYYVGQSYGTRIGEKSNIVDWYTGISNTWYGVTAAIEYHNTKLTNWYYDYNNPGNNRTSLALFSLTYSF